MQLSTALRLFNHPGHSSCHKRMSLQLPPLEALPAAGSRSAGQCRGAASGRWLPLRPRIQYRR